MSEFCRIFWIYRMSQGWSKDNFFKNLGRDLIRVTLKKLSELAIAKQNQYAGYAMNIANMATEKADTRNWQSLPGQIQFRSRGQPGKKYRNLCLASIARPCFASHER